MFPKTSSGIAASAAASAYAALLKQTFRKSTRTENIATPIERAPVSTDHSQPNNSWLAMMKTKASETRRRPAGSIGTGRHSASVVNAKNIAIPNRERGLGWLVNAATAAQTTTGTPATHVARTYPRSLGGNAGAIRERRGTSFLTADRGLVPASPGATGNGKRCKGGNRDSDPHKTCVPTNHCRASLDRVAGRHRICSVTVVGERVASPFVAARITGTSDSARRRELSRPANAVTAPNRGVRGLPVGRRGECVAQAVDRARHEAVERRRPAPLGVDEAGLPQDAQM